jgi:uncharacterized protein (DUF2249 family)
MEQTLDVSMLEPCEPLERTLEALQQLEAGDHLRVIHRREPHPLYQLLEKGGFSWHTVESEPGRYEIFIWKRDDLAAQNMVQQRAGI